MCESSLFGLRNRSILRLTPKIEPVGQVGETEDGNPPEEISGKSGGHEVVHSTLICHDFQSVENVLVLKLNAHLDVQPHLRKYFVQGCQHPPDPAFRA